jgi:hypothetical protein
LLEETQERGRRGEGERKKEERKRRDMSYKQPGCVLRASKHAGLVGSEHPGWASPLLPT